MHADRNLAAFAALNGALAVLIGLIVLALNVRGPWLAPVGMAANSTGRYSTT